MWHIIQDNKPMPYSDYGYNFNKHHHNDQELMLKGICTWLNYTIGTYGGHKPGHPYHVPSIIPAYGDYTNWMAVRGIHTDTFTYPLPENLTIYGFWVNDPLPGGIGENTYKDITTFATDYYQPMTTGNYVGEYLSVVEPPENPEDCSLYLAPSPPRFTPFQQLILGMTETTKGISDSVETITDQWIIHAAIAGLQEQLIPFDTGFAQVFMQTTPGDPLYVLNPFGENYYLVPFNLQRDQLPPGQEENTLIVVAIDASRGCFKEASWVEHPVEYLPISYQTAQELAYTYAVEELDLNVGDPTDLRPELIHRSSSLYHPEWQILYQNYGIYINQEGIISHIILK
jgi:hypothetical protein